MSVYEFSSNVWDEVSLRVFCVCSDGSVLREHGDGDHADGIRERPSGGGTESQFQQS